MSFFRTILLIASPAITAIGTLYLLIMYGNWGWLYPVTIASTAVYFNKARKTRYNTGKPEIDDREYWRGVNGKRLE